MFKLHVNAKVNFKIKLYKNSLFIKLLQKKQKQRKKMTRTDTHIYI